MEIEHVPLRPRLKTTSSNSSKEKLIEVQRAKKLNQARKELDEFTALQLQREFELNNDSESCRGRTEMTHNVLDSPRGSYRFRGSNLSLISLDGAGKF